MEVDNSSRLCKIDKLRLIDEVHKRPGLWNFDNKRKKKLYTMECLWKEVAAIFRSDVTANDCKNKWRQLRVEYRKVAIREKMRIARAKKNGTYDHTVDYDCKLIWYKNMSFMRPILTSRPNYWYSDHDSSQSSSETQDTEASNTETNSDLDSRDGDKTSINTDKKYFDARKLQEAQTNVLNEPFNTGNFDDTVSDIKLSNDITYAGDFDYIFLVSCLEHMKVMNKYQNLEIRARITDLILNIRLSSPSPSSDQKPNLEDLQRNLNVLQTKTLNIRRFDEVVYAADCDYHFLISCLPQMKVMTPLQNIEFRAKTNNLIFKILSEQK